MTNIIINEIKITSSQIWLTINTINGHYNYCFDPNDVSNLLRLIQEKEITIISSEYHNHNDYNIFENNFMIQVLNLLNDANHPLMFRINRNTNTVNVPIWIITKIADKKISETTLIKIVTIKNIIGEKIQE